MPSYRAALALACALLLSACAQTPNPSFPVTRTEAKAELRAMRAEPRPFDRPVVVLGGFGDPGFQVSGLASQFRRMTPDPHQVIEIAFFSATRFDSMRARVIDKVDAAFPTDDPAETVEVDVVAMSMGGLVARESARPIDGERRLRIRRLFTISTPHQGAQLAALPIPDQRVPDMRAGSEFLTRLDGALESADYELVCYTRLGDFMVGPQRTAPDGHPVRWVSTPPLELPHGGALNDPRIVADIALRLRNETPLSREPAAPLPE